MTSIFKSVTVLSRCHSTYHRFSRIKVIVIINNIIIWWLLLCYKTIWRFIKLITLMMNIWKLLLCLQELILIIISSIWLFSEIYLRVIHGSQRVILAWRKAIAICLRNTHVLISFTRQLLYSVYQIDIVRPRNRRSLDTVLRYFTRLRQILRGKLFDCLKLLHLRSVGRFVNVWVTVSVYLMHGERCAGRSFSCSVLNADHATLFTLLVYRFHG
jgi:hypothetical protein